ncbi:MAG: hypothetical protein WBA51_09100 [Erythrobacter sp.]
MSEYWLAAALGAGSGGLLLALFARADAKLLAQQGFIALAAMLWIYVGVRLGVGTVSQIAWEALFALAVGAIVQILMLRWPPVVGIAILFHGAYDVLIGPHTGVAEWYPPLCGAFDLVVGAGITVLLLRKRAAASN